MAGQTTFECDARGASVEALRAEALEHEARFSHWQDSNGAAGMELFRRAIVERDEAAWRAVVEIYGGMLAAQAGRRALRGLIAEDDGFCVDRAFQRFWIATRRNRLEAERFGDLSAVLKYLKMCLASVLLDEARARRRAGWVSLEDVAPEAFVSSDPADLVVERLSKRELWSAIDQALADTDERLIARLSFRAGLTPREILTRHPERFRDVFHVYRTKRNMIERLRRAPEIRALLSQDPQPKEECLA